jgi:hypothetical protein
MSPSTALFLAIVAGVAWLFVRAGWKISPATVIAVCVVSLVVPGVLASLGWLDRYEPPPPALVMVLGIMAVTVALAFSSFGSRLVTDVPLSWLVGFQAFRAPLEWWLHRIYTEGIIPVQLTYEGRNFDIITGVTALVVAGLLASGVRSRAMVIGWNLLGFVLLFNIVIVSILSTPVPFRYFMNDPPNLVASTFPYVWLPTFLVQAALFGHLLVFRAIRRSH